MMGTKEREFAPIVDATLEDLVPRDHFYRHLDTSLDLSFVRDLVKECYSPIGRPSIDPVVFFKLQLVMFFEGVRSERRLMEVASDRLSIRWYLGYDLREPLPDHSSLTRIRERYGQAVFRRFFDAVVERCIGAGLVWGEELYFDATKVQANASRASVRPRFAVATHLEALFPESVSRGEDGPRPEPLPVGLPEREFGELAEENAGRHDWIENGGQQDRAKKREEYRRVADYLVSGTVPTRA